MRILHILDHSLPLHSGYTFRTLAILRQQRALGWHTMQLTSAKQGPSDGAQQLVDGWHFYRTAPDARWWARLPVLRQAAVIIGLAVRLRRLAQRIKPDILHAHSPALNAIAALNAGRALGIPVVYEVRAFWEDAAADHGSSRPGGLRYRLTRALETYALRRADAVTTICDGLRRELCARGVPAHKITVIPNAVDAGAFSVTASGDLWLAHKLGLHGHLVLGFIGSFYAYEGLALLLRAMPRLLAAQPALRLLLAGGGPQEAALQVLAAQLGIAHAVVFAGRVPHAQVAAYYQLVDICVYPRLPMRLTELVTPLKPLEAMAQGRLVVASDVGGHRELVEHGKTGMLFRAGDAEALAQAILALLLAPASWPALRRQARAFVETERSWGASVGRYAPVYARVAAARMAVNAAGVMP
ncbi:TIGR04063 family PEP-CTERM/XrtA system glycosyltransferase [Janthinobacterium lividum]|uniref:TIGR04063 family PEP-CTERM/XrtA system glycosyltransferase n=1 Tax=Janthinobacterium lividum TaxID=29581 RepID=UPI000873C7BC|nr:TIGR04063 family PEP-CTERM/XrtA system glycosyltransferase [Janthinobacterium lividum]MCC7713297.1 glycosyltransferase, exosortase A system-associated [Janthinobacterium lividum]OEZ61117.1 GDP-mannose-dependent alpha-(1-6)-phosphatidylinositol monomannoside mannosyltransferase [Janthinobacterium lividum]WQE26365.1 TIGR04063 family PEP-CTERM/XrtA system glycosyltransferase [Janthinobacterium lividum]STQ97259.1 GDP-mannose-dependent alpha-(1-6)-phosphatidylinositol monomannoside mannosyltransf